MGGGWGWGGVGGGVGGAARPHTQRARPSALADEPYTTTTTTPCLTPLTWMKASSFSTSLSLV